ncbi:LpqB family beta-propeller domain-containing protein [Microbacterium sp. LWO13-1.2]|uniref:LpqB family beta-propeller domain-containing protein n=1 Tax=Microbacterium sp. LWO13-1.2 TaxID=3135262 RepID=UPI00313A40CE
MTDARRRVLRGIAVVAAAVLLSACTGLPTSSDVEVGLPLGQVPDESEFLPLASGPVDGAGPAEIVEGFMEAAITPDEGWQTARKFLTPEFAATWRPAEAVAIDADASTRRITSSVQDGEEAEQATEADVQVQTELVASVDETGEYSDAPGPGSMPFQVVRAEDGEWRIAKAPDGIVIDERLFSVVFIGYALSYFDQTWKRLVPDVRWFPRRPAPATTIAQALIGGTPSAWLEPAVQSAFPPDVRLALGAVPIGTDQIADVALNSAAQNLDQTTLARMRTQLERSLADAGVRVNQVQFSVDGRVLGAGVVEVEQPTAPSGSLVLAEGAFGTIVGDEITPIPGVSSEILSIAQPIAAIDVAADDSHAAVQLDDGSVFRVGDGQIDQLPGGPGLVTPSIDPYGYTWTVPTGDPRGLIAWGAGVTEHRIAKAFPDVSGITHLRVAADGARVAAVVNVGGQRRVVVAAVIRDGAGVPVALGDEVEVLGTLPGAAIGLVWLGSDRLGILTGPDDPMMVWQRVAGPSTSEAAPSDAVSIAGSRTTAGVRVLGASGALFARSGSAWREATSGVSLLATRAGQ